MLRNSFHYNCTNSNVQTFIIQSFYVAISDLFFINLSFKISKITIIRKILAFFKIRIIKIRLILL